MKIDVSGGYSVYHNNRSGDSKASKSGAADGGKKATDVVEFSRGNTAIADKGLFALKAGLQRDISASASPERIEQLRAEIKNGTYHIPTEALVDSLLGE